MSDGNGPHIAGVMPGRTVERGIDDANNMGAAMAPAVIDTLTRYFTQTGTSPADYDLIATGDLGVEGHGIVSELMKNEGYDMGENYNDCGMLIYDMRRAERYTFYRNRSSYESDECSAGTGNSGNCTSCQNKKITYNYSE